jgi:purine-cytosine permease-like protein
MKKFFVCFFIFVITGIGSAFLSVPGDVTFVVGGICAVLYLVFSRKKNNKKMSKEEKNRREFEKAEQDFNRYMTEWSDEYNNNLRNRR